MPDFGGMIRFTYNGTPIRVRAKVELEPGDFSYTAEHNQDGSFARFVQPMGPVFDVEFEDSVDGVNSVSLNWNAVVGGGPYNITISEDTNGVSHTITNGSFTGRAKIDRLRGLVTGLTIQGAVGSYQQIQT